MPDDRPDLVKSDSFGSNFSSVGLNGFSDAFSQVLFWVCIISSLYVNDHLRVDRGARGERGRQFFIVRL